jgi:hypothetical protein
MECDTTGRVYYTILNIRANSIIGVAVGYRLSKLFGLSVCEFQNYTISCMSDHERPLFLDRNIFVRQRIIVILGHLSNLFRDPVPVL